jgi:hypothetical protein
MIRSLTSFEARKRREIMEQALGRLCQEYAPQLSNLIYNPGMPDPQLTVLLEWADDLAAADPSSGLDLEVLAGVLPALNTAFLASFGFSGVPARDPCLRGRMVDLELTNLGDGELVQRACTCASLLAVGRHGSAGVALVARADQELRAAMDAISQAIARRP